MPINAGNLNRRITVKQQAAGADAAGQPSTTWETVASMWADIRVKRSADEGVVANASVSESRYTIRVRFREDVTAGMRVEHDGQVFDIEQVTNDYAFREATDLSCVLGGVED